MMISINVAHMEQIFANLNNVPDGIDWKNLEFKIERCRITYDSVSNMMIIRPNKRKYMRHDR